MGDLVSGAYPTGLYLLNENANTKCFRMVFPVILLFGFSIYYRNPPLRVPWGIKCKSSGRSSLHTMVLYINGP